MVRLLCTALLLTAATASAPLHASSAARDLPATDAPQFSPQQIRSDFDTLYRRLQDSHYDLFARRPKAEYDALHEVMRAGFDAPATREELQWRFQRFVAYGNVAHASIGMPATAWEAFRAEGGKALPLLLRVEESKVYVLEDAAGLPEIAPGDEVVSIDGVPARRWLAPLRDHVSADNDYLAHAQMERLLPMLAWRHYGEREQFVVQLRQGNGPHRTVTVPALDRTGLQAAAADRVATDEPDWNAREARMLEDGVAYLRPGPFYDNRPEAPHPWNPSAFKDFIDAAFRSFIGKGASSILVDLRNNPGGDNSFSDPMVAWFADAPFRFSPAFDIRISEAAVESNRQRLRASGGDADSTSAQLAALYAGKPMRSRVQFPIPEVQPREGTRFEGCVYLLVNRHSYSNTVLVAAIVQDYGFGTVLGEETADLASTYGAMERFTLPHTGIEVGFPKARIVRPSGDVQPRGVVPDIAIRTPIAAGSGDVVLQQAMDIARRRARCDAQPSSE